VNCISSGAIVRTGGSQPCIGGAPNVKYSKHSPSFRRIGKYLTDRLQPSIFISPAIYCYCEFKQESMNYRLSDMILEAFRRMNFCLILV